MSFSQTSRPYWASKTQSLLSRLECSFNFINVATQSIGNVLSNANLYIFATELFGILGPSLMISRVRKQKRAPFSYRYYRSNFLLPKCYLQSHLVGPLSIFWYSFWGPEGHFIKISITHSCIQSLIVIFWFF